MMKFYKIMFLASLMMGTLISISAYSWMGMWMGLEINLLSIMPLMNNIKTAYSSESSLKYFITQALASSILLISVILLSMDALDYSNIDSMYNWMLSSSLLTKMGMAPFHFWFPEIIDGLDWFNCTLILTWQKIAPMVLFFFNTKSLSLMIMVITISMLVGGIMGLNQTSLRKILAYSSINHMGWMMAALMKNLNYWVIYFAIYAITTIIIIMMLESMNIFFIKQLIFTMKNKILKISFLINFLSMGGLPPFLGFYPKWLVINDLVKSLPILGLIMVIMTMITLYYYVRILFTSITVDSSQLMIVKTFMKNQILMSLNLINLVGLAVCSLIYVYL